jgi:hypothetical protein
VDFIVDGLLLTVGFNVTATGNELGTRRVVKEIFGLTLENDTIGT